MSDRGERLPGAGRRRRPGGATAARAGNSSRPRSPMGGPRLGAHREGWDLTRLFPGDVFAVLAAFALFFILATDWYSTKAGDAARRIEQTAETKGQTSGEIGRALEERAVPAAERREKNAWQAPGPLDRVILLVSLAAVAITLAAAALRAMGRVYRPPLTPSTLAALLALLGVGLIVVRMIDQPGLDTEATVRPGVPLAVLTFALLALGAGRAMRREARSPAVADGAPAGGPTALSGSRPAA